MINKLPEEFRQYFWDVKFEEVDPVKKAHFVIQRLLSKGDKFATKWVKKNYSLEQIQVVLKTNRDFSPKYGEFWGMIFGVPNSEIKCLQEPYRTQRMQLWPY